MAAYINLYILAKEGTKALQLTYDDRNMMNVLTKQIKNCKLEEESKKVGFLDLVGKDRLYEILENKFNLP